MILSLFSKKQTVCYMKNSLKRTHYVSCTNDTKYAPGEKIKKKICSTESKQDNLNKCKTEDSVDDDSGEEVVSIKVKGSIQEGQDSDQSSEGAYDDEEKSDIFSGEYESGDGLSDYIEGSGEEEEDSFGGSGEDDSVLFCADEESWLQEEGQNPLRVSAELSENNSDANDVSENNQNQQELAQFENSSYVSSLSPREAQRLSFLVAPIGFVNNVNERVYACIINALRGVYDHQYDNERAALEHEVACILKETFYWAEGLSVLKEAENLTVRLCYNVLDAFLFVIEGVYIPISSLYVADFTNRTLAEVADSLNLLDSLNQIRAQIDESKEEDSLTPTFQVGEHFLERIGGDKFQLNVFVGDESIISFDVLFSVLRVMHDGRFFIMNFFLNQGVFFVGVEVYVQQTLDARENMNNYAVHQIESMSPQQQLQNLHAPQQQLLVNEEDGETSEQQEYADNDNQLQQNANEEDNEEDGQKEICSQQQIEVHEQHGYHTV
jgi:hypothetical protein